MSHNNTALGAGTLVRSDRMHGIFGTIVDVRPQARAGFHGWGQVEYNVRNGSLTSWIDERQLQTATLEDIAAHYQQLMSEQNDKISQLLSLACICADHDPWRATVHVGDCPLVGWDEDEDEEEGR